MSVPTSASGGRRSRNTKGLGKPKKGGAGGKYTWGAVLAEDQDGVAVDHNDPNYDSDEDGMPVSLQYEFAEDLAVYKLAVCTFCNTLTFPILAHCLKFPCDWHASSIERSQQSLVCLT